MSESNEVNHAVTLSHESYKSNNIQIKIEICAEDKVFKYSLCVLLCEVMANY